MTLEPDQNTNGPRLKLSVVRDTTIVATLIVLGLYAGSAFLIPLTMALLINVLIIALSDRVIALTRVPVWLANVAAVTVRIGRFVRDHVHSGKSGHAVRPLYQHL